jgi:hypothetical protein
MKGLFAKMLSASGCSLRGLPMMSSMQIPVHRGQSFRRIADSIPVIADSF